MHVCSIVILSERRGSLEGRRKEGVLGGGEERGIEGGREKGCI